MEKLTRYERARIIGARAFQIAMGAPFVIDFTEKVLEEMKYNPIKIAEKELESDKLNIKIRPKAPN